MTNKMISNSDILSGLFNKKEYSFLQEIDKKLDIIDNQKSELNNKENEIKDFYEINEIDNVKKEKVFEYIENLRKKVDELEIRIKELNQAIIRLIVDKETEYKYQTQDVKQIVCFAKDKIEEYMSLEKKLNKELYDIDVSLLDILEGKDIIVSDTKDVLEKENIVKKEVLKEEVEEVGNIEVKDEVDDIKQSETLELVQEEKVEQEPKRRVRQGSALNENKVSNVVEEKSIAQAKETELKIDEKDVKYNIENNILLISEKVGKIFLPYKKEDVQSYLLSYPNEYKNFSDVIEKEYILPLDEFMKNQTLSRFREMYDLIRNKELKSMIEAMKISTKFMFRYELNPAIIAACNSKDELDKYLECLEQNRLEEFDVFDIKFELNLL